MGLVRDVWPLVNLGLALVLLGVAWHGSTLSRISGSPQRRAGCTLLILALGLECVRATLGVYVIQSIRVGRGVSLPDTLIDVYAMLLPTLIRGTLILAIGMLLSTMGEPRGRR